MPEEEHMDYMVKSVRELAEMPLSFSFAGLSDAERQAEILHWFHLAGAAWRRSEVDLRPGLPHVRLRSGLCTNGYFNCSLLLSYPNVAFVLAREVAEMVYRWLPEGRVDWVVGSSYAAVAFSNLVALHLGCRHAFTEKVSDPNRDGQVLRRFSFGPDEIVLDVEELTVTKRTPLQVARAVADAHGHPVKLLPQVGALVFRPPSFNPEPEGPLVVAPVYVRVQSWEPEHCPYCAVGSQVIGEAKDMWPQLLSSVKES